MSTGDPSGASREFVFSLTARLQSERELADRLAEALRAIMDTIHDPLLDANLDAFAVHAIRRLREQAPFAVPVLAAYDAARGTRP